MKKLLKFGLPTFAAGALMVGVAVNAQAQDTSATGQQPGTDQQMNPPYVPPATDMSGTQAQTGQPTVTPTTPPTTTLPPTTEYGTGGSGAAMRDAGTTGGFDDFGTGGTGTAGRDAGTGFDVQPNTGTTGYDGMNP